tara:strand:- start:7 stop:288 length:282 start_codon:yes stop_codon:yes gene_type:complete
MLPRRSVRIKKNQINFAKSKKEIQSLQRDLRHLKRNSKKKTLAEPASKKKPIQSLQKYEKKNKRKKLRLFSSVLFSARIRAILKGTQTNYKRP